jgi:CDP-diacylglycerol--serine O-phosphatidyltransferase
MTPPGPSGRPARTLQERKAIYLLPNTVTAANMVLGILAVTYAFTDALTLKLSVESKILPFVWPARLILICIFIDFLDGRLARATGTTSRFGVEFDSLADLVSFGVAPAVLIYLSVLRYLTFWGVPIAVLYVVCTAIRLARFNVQAEIEERDHFMGLPSPAAAGLLVSYVLLSRWMGWYGKGPTLNTVMGWYEENINLVEFWLVPLLTVLIAVMMVSNVRYPSFKKLNRETIRPITMVGVVMAVFWIVYAAEIAVFVLLLAYLVFGLVHSGVKGIFARQPERAGDRR